MDKNTKQNGVESSAHLTGSVKSLIGKQACDFCETYLDGECLLSELGFFDGYEMNNFQPPPNFYCNRFELKEKLPNRGIDGK